MTRDEIDTLWQQALQESVKANEPFTRYRFAALVARHEREACAQLCETMAGAVDLQYACRIIAEQIRART